MKKIALLLSLVMLNLACQEKKINDPIPKTTKSSQIWHYANEEEYFNSTPEIKRLLDLIDAGVNGIDESANELSYIKFNKIENKTDKDKLIFFRPNNISKARLAPGYEGGIDNGDLQYIMQNVLNLPINGDVDGIKVPGGTCKVCGLGSAYSCKNAITSWMDKNGLNTVSLTITRTGGCVGIAYWGNKG